MYVYRGHSTQDLRLQASYRLMLTYTYVYTSHKHRKDRRYRYNRFYPRMHTAVLLHVLFRYIDNSAAECRPPKITLYVFGKPKLSEVIARYLLWY